ncbi:UvrD-helicase domain-containing protein [Xylanibacter ruminicola]|uniref:DNA 3'-5' helicase n=1 Tax=Xylanibacter ruminicola TaxID=839 RepID=A0A1M6SE96_XYLRU|nr:UvrD-helicase domain-containing protein [Xylanibacter ruminicola]SHK42979.1 ATP-dependent exoDNAse (exonuclease V) beta subunit (contains helicase and exonuclease domains) [Xylanibacter ruminicola]
MKNVTYINASAGSGKTYTLTHTLADLISDQKVKPEQVIMTTFTVKAASEMKEEAKKVLYEKGLFEEASRLDQAMIGTIHSVANALINKYWFFLGLSPDMGVMAEEDTQFYTSQSLSDLPTQEELKTLHAFCEDFDIQYKYGVGKRGVNYDYWKEDILRVITYTTNYELDSYERSIKESLDYIRQFVRSNIKSDYTKEELTAILNAQKRYAETQRESKKKQDILAEIRSMRRGLSDPTIGWYKRLAKLLNAWTSCAPEAEEMRDRLAELWHWPLVYQKQEAYIRLLFDLAARWRDRYTNYKKEKNLLDYNDMEKYMRDLLTDEKLSEEISMDYRYLFVDEYQDCSPIQVKIFDRLSELMEHSYWVGDYKQAIYGFRGSDITLTKAVVDRIATGQNGCEMAKPLDTSYRSLPDIVKVCNETFKRTFAGVLDEKSITLKEHRENKEGITSLRYWDLSSQEDVGLPHHIAHLIQQGVKPSDIAVLGRANAPLNEMAGVLTDNFGIPASRENLPVSQMAATPLVLALLALVASEKDSLAKAQIAILTEQDFGTKELIESKLLFDAEEDTKDKDFLNDVPLVKRLLELRPMLKQQSVAALVETMIIELDLYNVVKKIGRVSESQSCLNTIIRTAYTYEQHCVQMNLPATVNGFMDYLTVIDPVGTGDANGVQLHTYHSSKGLQWKYVILTSLRERMDDPAKCVKQSIYGIHFNYSEQPSAETPYPEVYIRVMPFVYGSGNTKVPEDIQEDIEKSELYKKVKSDSLSECNRLLYVGMTRPQDVMILALEKPAKNNHELQWLQDVGLDCVQPQDNSDLLGVGMHFIDETLTPEEGEQINSYHYMADNEKMKTRRIPYQQELCEADRKYLSPSSQWEKGHVEKDYKICDSLKRGTLVGRTMADVGNCIHQIYCGIEQKIDNEAYYKDLIASYGLSTYLIDYEGIRTAWEELVAWLTEEYGPATHIYHERPFSHLKDGQVFTGSIDLVWQTEEGDILIDFKTCPLGHKHILNEESDHYAGWYAGQLDAYTDALEAAGEKVIKRYIYYPVSGMLCEISRAFKAPKIVMNANIYCFDASNGFDINKMIEGAAKVLDAAIMCAEHDPDEEEIARTTMYIKGGSSQGIETILLKSGLFTINLPYLASRTDVALAFTLMREAKKLRPDLVIYDGDEETFADLSEDNEVETYYYRLDNMSNIIEKQDNHIGVNGLMHEFHIFPEYIKAQMPDVEPQEWTYKAFEDFIDIQWNYGDYDNFSRAEIGAPDGEEFIGRILGNNKGFAGVCQKVILYKDKETKIVPIDDFFEATKDNKYVKRLDYAQFVIDEMPDDEWERFYDSFEAEPLRHPKTYLLRWNPTISSYTLNDYRNDMEEYPDGFRSNWSIYEWEEAHKGDRFFMLRTGDDKAGIVYRGEFLSDPYEGDDWAGQKGKKRQYIDIGCYDFIPADNQSPIDIELLEKEIPEIDWRKGHSGELLSEETADKLNDLWNNTFLVE